ncbi:MAG: hypothetical protein WA944_22130, partial [Mycobacterium sp.]
MSTSPASRSGSSFSATTREHIAPTVRHVTRQNVDTVFLSHLPASQTARSSKSRVNPDPGRANGTDSASTPCSGQRNRRRRSLSTHTR